MRHLAIVLLLAGFLEPLCASKSSCQWILLRLVETARDQHGCGNCWLLSSHNLVDLLHQTQGHSKSDLSPLSVLYAHLLNRADEFLDGMDEYKHRVIFHAPSSFQLGGTIQKYQSVLAAMKESAPHIEDNKKNTEDMIALFNRVNDRLNKLDQELIEIDSEPNAMSFGSKLNAAQEAKVLQARAEIEGMFSDFAKQHGKIGKKRADDAHLASKYKLKSYAIVDSKGSLAEGVNPVTLDAMERTIIERVQKGEPVLLSFSMDGRHLEAIQSRYRQNGNRFEVDHKLYPEYATQFSKGALSDIRRDLHEKSTLSSRRGEEGHTSTEPFLLSHQVVITGVEVKRGKIRSLRVLNSWGGTGRAFMSREFFRLFGASITTNE